MKKNKRVSELLNDIYTDMLMLKEYAWEPDEDSVQASIETVETIASELQLPPPKDTRE